MNAFDLKVAVDQILFTVSQMAGITLPRIFVALAGLLILVAVVVGRWERRIKIVPALLGGLLGGLMVALAANTSLLHWMLGTSHLQRIRFFLGLLSLLVVAVTFESIRIARLRERYALLWMITSGMVFLAALFPQAIQFLTVLLGVQYVTAVVMVVFTFLLLVVFHFSIALSGLEEDRAKIAQRCALLELRVVSLEKHLGLGVDVPGDPSREGFRAVPAEAAQPPAARPVSRRLRGAEAGAFFIIGLAVLSVLWVGLRTSEPLIGDEVTHYFMLKNQAEQLPVPAFSASIPNSWSGHPEVRGYPHPNGWHYLGAIVERVFSGHFFLIQLYHSLFWLQLLLAGFLWSRARGGATNRSSLLYVIVLASVPMNLLFSVSFYQDVPMAAQALTAFYLLDRRRYGWSLVFMGLALWMKVTGIIFVPPYLVVAAFLVGRDVRGGRVTRRRGWVIYGAMAVAVYAFISFNGWILNTYGRAPYYPTQQIERMVKRVREQVISTRSIPPAPTQRPTGVVRESGPKPVTAYEAEIIANHPGDLRKPVNFLLYGGGLVWMVLLGSVVGLIRPRCDKILPEASRRRAWPLLVGLFYMGVTYSQLVTAPDARFFLPALPFVVLPLCEWCMRLPRTRWLLAFAAVIGLMQGAYVLKKTAELRQVTPEVLEAITYLKQHPPEPNRVFMYPEGNYRIFPAPHDWYMGYRLREMWTGDNDKRLELLRSRRIGAVVIKKHLVAPMDPDMHDLGIYPPEFVRELRGDDRFALGFENEAVIVFRVSDGAGKDAP